MQRRITLGNIPVTYELQYKNVKRINLRVHPDGRVSVSANPFVLQSQVDQFLIQNGDFILQALEKFQAMREGGDGMAAGKNREYRDGDTVYLKGIPHRLRVLPGGKEGVEAIDRVLLLTQKDVENAAQRKKMVEKYLTALCRQEVERMSQKIYPAFERLGVQWPQIRIRSMISRWGSCHPTKGNLTFARQLIEVPECCIEYVVVHEFSHFIHPDHSARFHDFLTEMMPDWKERKKLLNSRQWIQSGG